MKTEQTPKRTLNRRKFLQARSTAAGLALLSACAAPPRSPARAPSPAEQILLRYSHWGNEDEEASTGALAGLHGAEP